MSVTSALYTGVTGLLANGTAINVIGNNVSNVNTTGFKDGRAVFADLLSVQQGNAGQIGLGTQIQKVQNIFTQGATIASSNVTDLEIQGDSFFALKAPNTAAPVAQQNQAFLSRAGAFSVDNSLTLVNPSGYQVLDTDGNPIKFSNNAANILAQATTFNTGASIAGALGAGYPGGGGAGTIAGDLDAAQAAVTAMPAGTAQTAAQALVTAAGNAWTAATTANTTFGTTITGDNAKAAMVSLNSAYSALEAAAAAAGTAVSAGTTTAISAATTQYAAVQTEMGKAFGKVTGISNDGVITYLGQDGVTQNYYDGSGQPGILVSNGVPPTTTIAVVSVTDPDALNKFGGSLYQATGTAGVSAAGFSQAANQPNGTSEQIVSNALEGSNVDMATEFVNMIVTQRAYTASSKTITTTDQMTQDVLNMIR